MEKVRAGKVKRYVGIFVALGIVVFGYLLFGPPELLAKSEAPIFCGGCHTLEQQYEAWSHAGAHSRKLCVDCHLPNQNTAMHYVWKSIDGIKDLTLFYTGLTSGTPKLSSNGAEVLQTNCIRCHESAVEFIGQERKCWECHRRLQHRRTGAMATL